MKKALQFFDRFLQRFVPDPFVIAILLTLLTLFLAVWGQSNQPGFRLLSSAEQIVLSWGDGVWKLADFTLHMSMILIGGFVVATSPPVKALLSWLVGGVRTPVQAVLFCTFTAIFFSWINWGLGLVVGGIVALEVGRKIPNVPFRVLVASSYSGFLVWHGGLSGSVPLDMNTAGKVFASQGQTLVDGTKTIFGTFNLCALAAVVLCLPLVNLFCLKLAENDESDGVQLNPEPVPEEKEQEPENWLNRSFLAVAIFVVLTAAYCYASFKPEIVNGLKLASVIKKLNLNSINLTLFVIGMLFHGTPSRFIRAVTEAAPKIAPILIQYPLYAAIMAVLRDSGLADQISRWFVENSSSSTFSLMSFYSAGLLNLFVPSGGGQWAVQAPIVLPAAQELGVDIPKVAMAVAWGDAWTNLAQPFWAIPLLTIAGLRIKDILGFCLLHLVATGLVLSVLLVVI